MKLAKDKGMIEEGCMLINKGMILGSHAKDILDDIKRDDNALGIGCYMLAQSIELLIKGLCLTFGETPPCHHIIKHSARMLINIYERKCPELGIIRDDLVDISDNAFAYVIQTWQKEGRYEFLTTEQDYVDKAEFIYLGLKRFVMCYQLNESN